MLVFAHRGFPSKTRTENTLEAFHEAVSHGVDGIEFDIRLSKDGEPVVVHDAVLNRVAGDSRRVAELTSTELGAIVLRHGGRIATLNDVTAHVFSPTQLDIEVKTVDVLPALIRKLKTSAHLRERTIVSSFKSSVIACVQEEVPDVRTLLLVSRWPLPLRVKPFLHALNELKPWGVGLRLFLCTSRRVHLLQRHGFVVAGWDERGMAREARNAKKLGVDIAILKNPPLFL